MRYNLITTKKILLFKIKGISNSKNIKYSENLFVIKKKDMATNKLRQ